MVLKSFALLLGCTVYVVMYLLWEFVYPLADDLLIASKINGGQ